MRLHSLVAVPHHQALGFVAAVCVGDGLGQLKDVGEFLDGTSPLGADVAHLLFDSVGQQAALRGVHGHVHPGQTPACEALGVPPEQASLGKHLPEAGLALHVHPEKDDQHHEQDDCKHDLEEPGGNGLHAPRVCFAFQVTRPFQDKTVWAIPDCVVMSAQTWVNGALGVGAVGVLLDSTVFHGIQSSRSNPGFLDERATANGILVSGALLWPVLFSTVVGYSALWTSPLLLVGFVIPVILILSQLLTGRSATDDTRSPDNERRVEAQILLSSALSIGILLLNLHSDKAHSKEGMKVLILAVVLCLALVVPSASLAQKATGRKILVQAVQRVCLDMAVGLVVTGVVLSVFEPVKSVASE